MVPQLEESRSVEECMAMIKDDWRQTRDPDEYLQQVGVKAADFAHLFGVGMHTEHIGLEAARWWEERVGKPYWERGFGRYFFQTFYETMHGGANNRCYETWQVVLMIPTTVCTANGHQNSADPPKPQHAFPDRFCRL